MFVFNSKPNVVLHQSTKSHTYSIYTLYDNSIPIVLQFQGKIVNMKSIQMYNKVPTSQIN